MNTLSDRERGRMAADSLISMNTRGLWTGLFDCQGTPVCIGDTLSFDEAEWGEPHWFVVSFENGELEVSGAPSEISEFCTVVSRAELNSEAIADKASRLERRRLAAGEVFAGKSE